ncbi:hypothetical protein LEN26_018898 [Aphanomyces euteiches]|nr:hypothetical protein LEN26_018898 [Aphanomyces euteiches]KAH9193113.1 hypothetical protein AeNC1_004907 [Aphanomyces euteiches]
MRHILLGLCLALLVSPSLSRSAASWNDRAALKMLFWATGGPSWHTPWPVLDQTSDPCLNRWYGILCNTQGKIISIKLSQHNLRGYLPNSFARLSSLQELDLSSNFLTDILPSTLANLQSLKILRLDHNAFTGVVPMSLATLRSLVVLTLDTNQFDAPIASQLYKLQNAPTFYLSFDNYMMPTSFDSN